MRRIFAIGLLIVLIACSKEKKQGNMIVQGKIDGLKKGTLYLQKMQDTALVTVDSIALFGNDSFSLTDNVTSPEMYYLTFDSNTTEKRIMFFGEEGLITISDDVKNFGIKPTIEGLKNQKVMDQYRQMTGRFQAKNLDIIEANLNAQKEKDAKKADSLVKAQESLLRRRYLYSVNFALANADSEAAPYIALTDLVDAKIKLLDTIYVSLDDNIKNSLYGKKLENFISEIKKNEE